MACILVVDDTHADRHLAKIILEKKGHTVLEVQTGEAALQHMRLHPFDLVITDIYMPGMNGLELVERMQADPLLARLPVVFYTAGYDEPTTRQAIHASGYAVLAKPVALLELVTRIEAILHEAARP